MEILKKDLCLVAYGREKVKDVFSECSKNGFVFPFLPIFDEDVETLFTTSFFLSRSFGASPSDLIQGFEIELDDGRTIKQGGRIKKTNTGYNLIPIFFGSEKRKFVSSRNPITPPPKFRVKKVYFKLITKGKVVREKVVINEHKKEMIERIIHSLHESEVILIRKKKKDKEEEKEICFLRTEVSLLKFEEKEREKEKSIFLPDAYSDIYEFLPAGRLYSDKRRTKEGLGEKVKLWENTGNQRENFSEALEQIDKSSSCNFVITSGGNQIFLVELI